MHRQDPIQGAYQGCTHLILGEDTCLMGEKWNGSISMDGWMDEWKDGEMDELWMNYV